MKRFSSWAQKKSKLTYLLFFVLLSLLILILPQSVKLTLSDLIFDVTFSPFYAAGNSLKRLNGVYEKNKIINQKLLELTLENFKLREEQKENERLRNLLEFKSESEYKIIPAEVIAREPNQAQHSVLIDMGEKEGIRQNMPVINMYGLVGKISQVFQHRSVVQLLLHPNCRVAAVDQRSRAFGIVKSDKGIKLKLEDVSPAGDIQLGDAVVSSGLGGIFPPGLKIGQVEEVEEMTLNLLKSASIKPEVNFNSLEELFILDVRTQ